MSGQIIRRCPRCGRKAHNDLLVQCPDCRVPFVFDEQPYTGLTPEQLRLVVAQIFGSWKFWVFLVAIVGLSAWGVVAAANKVIEIKSREYLAAMDEKATNQLGNALANVSNQIELQFRQPRIRSAIEQVARDHALDLFSNGVQPSVSAFQDAVDMAAAQLARSSNALAQLEAAALAAKTNIPPPVTNQVLVQVPVPVAVPTNAPAASAPAPAPDSAIKLALFNRTVTPVGAGYTLTLFFKVSGSVTNGMVVLDAATYKLTAKILNFALMTSGVTEPPTYNDTGDIAQLRFPVTRGDAPLVVVLEFSAPTIVRVVSDSLDNDLTIPIAAEKMQVPAAAASK